METFATTTTVTTPDPEAQLLVAEARERRRGKVRLREFAVEGLLGGSFVVVAGLMAVLVEWRDDFSVQALALSALAFVAASSVSFEVGDGYAIPTQIVFVAMLFVLPPPVVPAVVGISLLGTRLLDSYRDGTHPSRALQAFADSWYSIGPALILGLAASAEPEWSDWPLYVAALAAQFSVDVVCSSVRAWVASGVPPRTMLRVLRWVYGVDATLAPLGLVLGFAANDRPYLILLGLPLLGLLAYFARERKARIDHALELSGAYRGTVMLLGQVVESDDAYTGEHSRGVVELSLAVADKLGLDARARVRVEFGALLHDIGKIAVPNEIINKPGPLNDEEWAVMRRHTIEGELMLKPIGGLLAEVGSVVRSSHEHYDGGGYPDGLAGTEIPIEARIVCCCDAFSAMTTDRSYRNAMPVEAALLELEMCAGTQFDPAVAEALVEIVEGGHSSLPLPAARLTSSPPGPLSAIANSTATTAPASGPTT
jgi:HD-GYP domain-containing protein (c-di-GMP phosphodiesterase class II)